VVSTSTELVGPLEVGKVTFTGGPSQFWRDNGRLRIIRSHATAIYDVPVDTRDPRYSACTDHRVACDCREAELAEQISELRGEYSLLRNAIDTVLAGHPTTAGGEDRYGQEIKPCQCTGCQIARLIYVYPKES
jgi:hypothetical protein